MDLSTDNKKPLLIADWWETKLEREEVSLSHGNKVIFIPKHLSTSELIDQLTTFINMLTKNFNENSTLKKDNEN